MRALVVINPVSGPARHRPVDRSRTLAETVLSRAGWTVEVAVTGAAGDAHRLAQAACASGTDLVVAWGGDGTINEVASALAFTSVALGIVPGGSGNGLARELGIPRDPAGALGVAAGARRRTIDAGEVDGRLFFNAAGIGLDAAIAAHMAVPGAQRGFSGYVRLALRDGLRYRARHYVVTHDGQAVRHHALFMAFANSRQYGNDAHIAPRARLDDGLLDLVVVENQPVWRLLGQTRALFRGTLQPGPRLRMTTFTELAVAGAAPLAFHVDGEPGVGGVEVVVRARPRALVVACP
jgi:YegS/Rv2252/BmrU family lipid kinase